jgi:hypothetical protein
MSVQSRPDLWALDGGTEEADLLAHLADAVLDYVADGPHANREVGAHHGQRAKVESGCQAHADLPRLSDAD